jgi:Chaperone of endosialidase
VGADYNTAAPTNGALIEGNVGIGTTTPVAPLHVGVASNFNLQNSSSVTYFNYNNNNTTGFTVTPLTGTQAASAIFSSNIFSGSSFVSTNGTFLAASDARLKNIIGRSDSAKDLETLQKIEVTDYTMKDTVKFGNRRFKKVIAQQVEKVYPTAVKTIGYKGFTFTPDIYEAPNSVKPDGQNAYTISLAKTHGLKEGETVRLITDKNPELNVVAHVVDEKTFTVTTKEPLGDKVFVYGKQCLDLKSIDYDAIAMLNVSATQELAKKVETLEAENAKLKGDADRLTTIEGEEKTKIAALQAENAKLTAFVSRVESLEQAFNRLQTKTASRPVALNQ